MARSVRNAIPFPVTNRDFPPSPPKIEGRVEQSFPLKNLADETVYVGSGKLVNRSGAPKNFLHVKLRLVDAAGATLQEKTVYGGNQVSIDKIKKTDPKDLDLVFQNKLGEGNKNINVEHDTAVSFMVIFFGYGGEPARIEIAEATAEN